MEKLFESRRAYYRKLTPKDYRAVAFFLQDPEVMYAWEHGFSDKEAHHWLQKNLNRYEKDGIGYLLMVDKATKETIGVAGLIYTDIEGEYVWEIGYTINKAFWGMGYAKEACAACIHYALDEMKTGVVYAQMRISNTASEAVAKKCGMKYVKTYDRFYMDKIMPHHVYEYRK